MSATENKIKFAEQMKRIMTELKEKGSVKFSVSKEAFGMFANLLI